MTSTTSSITALNVFGAALAASGVAALFCTDSGAVTITKPRSVP